MWVVFTVMKIRTDAIKALSTSCFFLRGTRYVQVFIHLNISYLPRRSHFKEVSCLVSQKDTSMCLKLQDFYLLDLF